MIETKNLKIYAASQNEMEKFIELQTNDVLKAAYTEMLNGCLENPEQWEWYAIWMIELKDGTHIGELCFKGLDGDGIVEIGYGITKKYQGHGYATEAVKAISNWAFQEPKVTAIKAEIDAKNIISKKVLENCGFIFSEKFGNEGPIYLLIRRGE
ncbi:MAG: GNAT family N-acetyltransferase [Elusimicrobia bacterium]|nr:GNAT family N-acetyltransferase [Elusimicrobiota bacterium]